MGRTLHFEPSDAEMKSVAEDLLKVLQGYISNLKETKILKDLELLQCNDTVVPWNKTTLMANRLLYLQTCAEKLQPFTSNVDHFCALFNLNKDLLQHLNVSGLDSTGCPTSSSDSPPTPDFDFLRISMQCMDCFSQQVAALLR